MSKKKQSGFKKRIRPHTRIPIHHGDYTRIARQLYDLIYWWGLKGCYMSNETLARQLECSTRSVQLARRQLAGDHVIIVARSNPYTSRMWARYHGAVMKCPVLWYWKDKQMDNPFYDHSQETQPDKTPPDQGAKIAPQTPDQGAKIAPKSVMKPPRGASITNTVKVSADTKPTTPSSRGSASSSASPTGSTGNRLFSGDSERAPQPPDALAAGASPDLDPFGQLLYLQKAKKLIKQHEDLKRAIHRANVYALERRAQHKKQKETNL